MSGGDWRALERAVTRVMAHCGWRDVVTIGRSGDLGADILAIRGDGPTLKTWVVQVKAVTGENYVGPTAITEVMHAMSHYGAQVAAVATNGTFTSSAGKQQARLKQAGFDLKLWNGVFLGDLLSKWPDDHHETKELRPYQDTIRESVIHLFREGGSRALFVVATGLGKTVIASTITRDMIKQGFRRVLVLCHSTDLALQLEQAFWTQLPKSIPTRVFMDGTPPHLFEGVNFGLYQTLISYLPSIPENAFDLIIVDEAHHAVGSQFRRCVEHFKPRLLLGMTATPWRGDGAMIDELFGTPVAKLSLIDGMKLGALANVDYRLMCDNINWPSISKMAGKNVSISDLNRTLFLPQRDEAAIREIRAAINDVEGARIAIFSPSIEHAEWFASQLRTAGIPSAPLSGCTQAERRCRLLDFAAGRLQAVTAVDVLNEGIDIPDVNILVFMRATHSRRIFIQQLGRGLRLSKGKTRVVVLDFVTDLRRLAEVCSMGNQAKKRAAGDPENIYLNSCSVAFSDRRVQPFVDAWLNDVADLADTEESEQLKFPEGLV